MGGTWEIYGDCLRACEDLREIYGRLHAAHLSRAASEVWEIHGRCMRDIRRLHYLSSAASEEARAASRDCIAESSARVVSSWALRSVRRRSDAGSWLTRAEKVMEVMGVWR